MFEILKEFFTDIEKRMTISNYKVKKKTKMNTDNQRYEVLISTLYQIYRYIGINQTN